VALFRVITTPADLPPKGTGRENGTFDFKGKSEVDPDDQRELAKDVAAFANALGGVLLVGAEEDKKTHTLGQYNPMKLAAAETLKVAYELAVAQRCHPQPVFDVVRIEVGPPLVGHVVAVNVYPIPLGPVGVRWDTDKKGPSFAFPLRTASQTHYMTPTELAMLMVPEIRRVAILLDSIPLDQRADVMLLARSVAPDVDPRTVTLEGVDRELTTAFFSRSGEKIRLPLDRIQSVWRRDDRPWCVAVDGAFAVADNTLVVIPQR
jgi:hypothetical protein